MCRIACRPSNCGLSSSTSCPISASSVAVRSTACATSGSTGTPISGFVDQPIRSARRALRGQRGVRLRRLRDDKRIAGLRHGEAVEHRRRVAHALRLHEVLAEAVAVLVLHRSERHASARRLEADAAAETRRNADRARRCPSRARSAPCRPRPPPCRRPSSRRPSSPRFHGVEVLPCSALSVVPAIEYSGAAERPRMLRPAALNSSQRCVSCCAIMPRHSRLPNSIVRPASWPKKSLIRNGTPRNGPAPSVRSSRSVDAIRIGFDDGVDGRIDGVDRGRGRLRQLLAAKPACCATSSARPSAS